ncbi:uncharacterized protein LY89DRAFT_667995 [Mollisia scopiformis]|uniref:Rhodopsin domain-containing protein n=1 Tax=Mollisia scopiformis TaxID=149040 RepID=A0A194XFN0_MOLSC|nr:uncharacterized protein LY89DRAFT_667995 [Mollisia scopiformis]KUJ18951.1 hypothetical protein LY89DRAFT_667995 [Mollisia scopiformis]
MTASLEDPEAVAYNQRVIIASTIVVFLVSNGSYIARLVARKKSGGRFQAEDWVMGLALPFSYIPAACLLYGLTVGFGKHVADVSKADLRKFNISLFVLQRGNPPCLLCVKTSILLLYSRLFPTRTFKRVAFGVWLFTLGWAVAAFFSNLLQCLPVAFFWDKTIPGGKCLPNALINIGMTNGVLSFVGDLIILSLPIPMIWKLQINARRKAALSGMFLLGGFVCLTSILRFVALAKINIKDITFTQVSPGIWTYIELGIGITSGNLPLLRPLFGRFFSGNSRNASSATPYGGQGSKSYPLSRVTDRSHNGEGFHRMDKGTLDVDVESVGESGSEIELNVKNKGSSNAEVASGGHSSKDGGFLGGGINVRTDVDLRIEEVRAEIAKETLKVQQRAR